MIHTNILDSERHRPDRLATEFTEDQKFVSEFLTQAVEAGMDPTEVAQKVVAGIRAEQFLILTHEAYPAEAAGPGRGAGGAARLPEVPDFD